MMLGKNRPQPTSTKQPDTEITSVSALYAVCQGSKAFYTKAISSATDVQLKSVFVGVCRTCPDISTYHDEEMDIEAIAVESAHIHPLARWYYMALSGMEKGSAQSLLGNLIKHERLVLRSINTFAEHQTNVGTQSDVADISARVQARVDRLWSAYSKRYLC